MLKKAAIIAASASFASAKVYFKEEFGAGWEDRWVVSDWKKDEGTAGSWDVTAGKWYGDAEADKGLKTMDDARFYAISAGFDEFSNEGKPLVIQFSVKHEQNIDCGGGYMKIFPKGVDQSKLQGGANEDKYNIMFGPDICGTGTKKTHVIFNYGDKNHLIKKEVRCESDEMTHLYTLIVKPDNTYEVLIDQKSVQTGSLYDDWDFLLPKEIKDPAVSKPTDWVDQKKIDDPEDVKPEGWDDVEAQIKDPEASQPEDWDEEDDGEWEAPTIPNPDYKGEWRPKKIDNPEYKGEWKAPKIPNPDYKGEWVHPEIDNPDYVEAVDVWKRGPIGFIGVEVWQVKSGTVFSDFILTDSVEEAETFMEERKTNEDDEKEAKKAWNDAKKEAEDEDKDDDDEDEEEGKDEL